MHRVSNEFKNKVYLVYNMDNKKFICRMISVGKGPNEFLRADAFRFDENSVMFLDMYRNKVQIFSLDNIGNCDVTPYKKFKLLRKNTGDVVYSCFYFNNFLIGSGLFKKDRFCIFSIDGVAHKTFGDFPEVKFNGEYDNYHLGYVFSSIVDFGSNSQSKKIAYTSNNSLSIYSYSAKKDEFNKTFDVQWYIPKIKEATYNNGKPSVLQFGNGLTIGAGNLAVTKKYLFFPFSKNEYIDSYKLGYADYFGYIFVMDWDGNPIARLKLDKRIMFPLEIDKEEQYLYSTHTDLETGLPQIVRFDISFL